MKHTKDISNFRIWYLTVIIISILISSASLQAQNYVTPTLLTTLSEEVDETSGLVNLNGEIWTHNDSGGEAELYQINTSTGEIIRTVEILDADNEDWEDITMDETYVYIGDIGNNDGNRTDLRIYRISRADLASNDVVEAEEISFFYSDQTSFEPNYHNTNFDCEALVHFQDQLYLFTKNWLDFETNCYVLPKTIGTHEAVLHSNFDVNCLISGATMMPSGNALTLIGYTSSGASYTWLSAGFASDDFFGGENTKLIWTLLSQIEGVCDAGPNDIYISSEKFSGLLDPTLYYLDISGFITGIEKNEDVPFLIYSSMGRIIIQGAYGETISGELQIFNTSGARIIAQIITEQSHVQLPINENGLFIVVLKMHGKQYSQKVLIP